MLNLVDQSEVLMVFIRNNVDHVLEKVFGPQLRPKILLDIFLVWPVEVQLLSGDHDSAVAGRFQLVPAKEPYLEKNTNIYLRTEDRHVW